MTLVTRASYFLVAVSELFGYRPSYCIVYTVSMYFSLVYIGTLL